MTALRAAMQELEKRLTDRMLALQSLMRAGKDSLPAMTEWQALNSMRHHAQAALAHPPEGAQGSTHEDAKPETTDGAALANVAPDADRTSSAVGGSGTQKRDVLLAEGAETDMLAVCAALGFDPTNHHNAAVCPYCREGAQTEPQEPAYVPPMVMAQSMGLSGYAQQAIAGAQTLPAADALDAKRWRHVVQAGWIDAYVAYHEHEEITDDLDSKEYLEAARKAADEAMAALHTPPNAQEKT